MTILTNPGEWRKGTLNRRLLCRRSRSRPRSPGRVRGADRRFPRRRPRRGIGRVAPAVGVARKEAAERWVAMGTTLRKMSSTPSATGTTPGSPRRPADPRVDGGLPQALARVPGLRVPPPQDSGDHVRGEREHNLVPQVVWPAGGRPGARRRRPPAAAVEGRRDHGRGGGPLRIESRCGRDPRPGKLSVATAL